MKLEYSIFTSPGTRRVNEDYADVVSIGDRYCFILCDGLGGHGMGDRSSRFVTEYIKNYFLASSSNEGFASDVMIKAQDALRCEQEKISAIDKMKTTAVVLVTDGSGCICLHVGDSRLYHFHDGSVSFHTRDHSIPQMLVLMGDITEEEIRNHPDRNKLLRALGDDREEIKYEKNCFEAAPGDAFLLCSDGFWEPVGEDEMCSLLEQTENANGWLDAMSRLAAENSRGKSMDNCTAIAVRVKG